MARYLVLSRPDRCVYLGIKVERRASHKDDPISRTHGSEHRKTPPCFRNVIVGIDSGAQSRIITSVLVCVWFLGRPTPRAATNCGCQTSMVAGIIIIDACAQAQNLIHTSSRLDPHCQHQDYPILPNVSADTATLSLSAVVTVQHAFCQLVSSMSCTRIVY